MRRLALALLLVLTACGGDPLFVRFGWIEKTKYSQHQYSLGTKVLLKTGAVGVITDCWPTPYYGENPVSPSYTVRVGYNKTKNKDWLGDIHTIEHGKFFIREFEIEKVLE